MKYASLAAAALILAPAAAHARPGDIWQMETNTDSVVLHYGVPPNRGEQDMPGILCLPHSVYQAILFTDRHHYPVRERSQDHWVNRAGHEPPWPMTMTVGSGAANVTLPARGEMETDDELVMVTADIPTSGPIVTTFQHTGQLRLSAAGDTPRLPPAPAPLVRRFFAACAALNR